MAPDVFVMRYNEIVCTLFWVGDFKTILNAETLEYVNTLEKDDMANNFHGTHYGWQRTC